MDRNRRKHLKKQEKEGTKAEICFSSQENQSGKWSSGETNPLRSEDIAWINPISTIRLMFMVCVPFWNGSQSSVHGEEGATKSQGGA